MLIIFKNKFLTKRIKFTSKIQIEKRKKQYESNISNNKISCKQPKIVLLFSVHHEPHVVVIIMIEINYSKLFHRVLSIWTFHLFKWYPHEKPWLHQINTESPLLRHILMILKAPKYSNATRKCLLKNHKLCFIFKPNVIIISKSYFCKIHIGHCINPIHIRSPSKELKNYVHR